MPQHISHMLYKTGQKINSIHLSLVEIYNVILSIDKKKPQATQTEINKKIITPIISDISNNIVNYLKSITLDDLYRKIKNIGIKSNTKKKIDFSI